MKFLNQIISELLNQTKDLSEYNLVLPGKRPVVFIKQILKEKQYSGVLPNFFTIEDLIKEISEKQSVQGISLWLFAFEIYREIPVSYTHLDVYKRQAFDIPLITAVCS